MTLFGILWIFVLLIFFLKNDDKSMLFITLFSMVFQCTSVLNLPSFSVGPQVITNIIFIIWYILKYKTIKVSHFSKIEQWAFILAAVVIISSLINQNIANVSFKIIQLITYIITFSIIMNLKNKIEDDFVIKAIKFITSFVLVVGIIQFLTTTNMIPRISLISELLFNERSESVYYWRDNYSRLCSSFMEPSYCGCFLIGALFYFLNIWDKNNKNIIIIILLLIELILTKSTTVYLTLSVCFMLFIMFSKNKNIKKIMIPISILITLILFVFCYDILDTVIFSKASSGSAGTRSYWNQKAMENFLSSKWIGTGYKNVRASSILLSLLGEIGIIGFISYAMMNFHIGKNLINNKINNNKQKFGICFSILAIVCCQFIACPDLDLCIYWLFFYFMALTFNNKEKKYD